MSVAKYKDGKLIKGTGGKESGKLAPVLADMTLGKAMGLHGEYAAGKQFLADTQDGSGDAVDIAARGERIADYSLGKLTQGSHLVNSLNLDSKAANMSEKTVKSLGKLADPTKKVMKGIAKAAPVVGEKASKALGAMKSLPVGDALTAAQGVRSLTDGSMSWATEDEKASTAMATTGAAVGGVATAAGASGTVAAASGAAAAASAGGAGVMGTIGAGLTALGPIGWATLALGAGAAALGVFGSKSYRKRGKW
tara:strand:+ start:8418 stop:9173 length:756 start_codon:yes stop_codon:yes gene_type:complete